jgi:hypothetical protein
MFSASRIGMLSGVLAGAGRIVALANIDFYMTSIAW